MKDALMGIAKSDLLGVTMGVIERGFADIQFKQSPQKESIHFSRAEHSKLGGGGLDEK